jgi:hypothetical protein
MLIKNIIIYIFCFYLFGIAASVDVTVINVKGDVKIRYGVEEEWQPAKTGMILRDIDSIISGAGGQAKLKLNDGRIFELGGNSYLDIVDLKNIDKHELFLFLMSKKILEIKKPDTDDRIRISNVSVVHGNSKTSSKNDSLENNSSDWSEQETNGAVSLYVQKFYPNTIVKLKKMISKYTVLNNQGKIFYYLAKSFNALAMKGQARENFQAVIEFYQDQDNLTKEEKTRLAEAREALNTR